VTGSEPALYEDRWVTCTPTELQIRGYYFPWGTKHVPYARIRDVRRVEMGTWTGKGRIWGTANPRYWAHLDPSRPRKQGALVLDVGGFVHPFVTPDDPDRVAEIVAEHRAG